MDDLEIEILAESVGNLQYDVTGRVVGDIANILREKAKNNKVMSSKYLSAADNLELAEKHIYDAWSICEKYMVDGGECTKHPRSVFGYKKIKDISQRIIEEDSPMLFISLLADDLWLQAYSDETLRGRKKTAANIYAASEFLFAAAEDLYVKLIK